MCQLYGFTWAVPTTPASLALHYNKSMFRDAGLDPDRPPETIGELDEYNAILTKTNSSNQIKQMGFLPYDPDWYVELFPFWFEGEYISNDKSEVTPEHPGMIAAAEWIGSFAQNFGLDKIQEYRESAGGFDSVQNAFFTDRVAMQLQGVWMASFIEKYRPDLEWDVATFPAVKPGENIAALETDLLVIPRGAAHVEEAWDFIQFTQQPENLIQLAQAHRKFPPLANISDEFFDTHPNPHIRKFVQLANSPNARYFPYWFELKRYANDLRHAFDTVWLHQATAKDAMHQVKRTVQPHYKRAHERWQRIEPARRARWETML
jgi:multiple sugar transport system substrate-binding protein